MDLSRGIGGASPAGMNRDAVVGGASPAGTSRGTSASNDKCNRLFEDLRKAMAAEAAANAAAEAAQNRFNSANEAMSDAITRRNVAESEWSNRYRRMGIDWPNIDAARKRWHSVSNTLSSPVTGISDWENWHKEREDWLRAEEVASRYSASEFEELFQNWQNAEKNADTARTSLASALANLKAAQAHWQQAADNLQKASDRYQKECGGGSVP
jgi:hypothetical protein